MRPVRLDLSGFTVFREPTVVDFTDADFFALVGPTGSGKSTILDAVCFALYGTVPRWNDRRAVGNALAPSAAEARVRLVFESAGARYVATRVVRRDGKGRVATSHAGLEALPPGFDLTRLDSGLSSEDLGAVLAGTPAEMEQAVLEAVGLPYEQFTNCVVLPQGQFAEFLHAKPAARQQILVNLLGLHVYERIREQATALAGQADAQLAATERVLADLADASDEAYAEAEQRVSVARRLAEDVATLVPALVAARDRAREARQSVAALEAELDRLGRVRIPAEAAEISAAVVAAQAAADQAAEAVRVAEDREEKLRGELAAAGDPATLHRLLDAYTERDRLAGQAAQLATGVDAARAEQEAAVRALDAATAAATAATEAVAAAERDCEAARTADRAASLRPHLVAGQPCPVCLQQVTAPPPVPDAPALAAAQRALADAKQRAQRRAADVATRDRAVRDLDRTLAAALARQAQVTERLTSLDAELADAPSAASARDQLAAIDRLNAELERASRAVRAARDAQRGASATAQRAEDRLRAAWRDFDSARDALAPLGPPPADRDDLGGAWAALARWAADQADRRRSSHAELVDAAEAAERDAAARASRIDAAFTDAGLAPPTATDDPSGYSRAAAVVVERAEAALARVVERREQADRLREQRAGYERDSQVAKALATHLRANNFERWLLEEALDALVDGASRILRELTAGQYDLVHDKGEFFVVDHHDAGLRRAVRTLSGGETFQASLALALALSERLSGMSTATASLESIMLDEGFGTLDAHTLDTVAATLENLAARGDRMVGVVTHVTALAERIPVRFEVRKDARSARVTRVDP
ncbi:MAG TPA: SMC family ATPase [Micromonosporaceae bacterium]